MAKKVIKRSAVLTNEHWDEVKGLLKKYSQSEVHKLTKWGSSTVSLIDRSDSYAHYRAMRLDANTRAGVVGPMRLKNYPMKPKPEVAVQSESDLDTELEKLGNLWNKLHEQITVIVELGVAVKSKEVVKELEERIRAKDIEIVSLKTVTDAAKKSNLVDTIKNSLMGKSN